MNRPVCIICLQFNINLGERNGSIINRFRSLYHSISSAWLMTFAKWFPIKKVDAFVVDYKTMIRAHVDYALMALFGLGFYGTGVELPVVACWCIAIGGFTNPTIFTIAAFDTNFLDKTKWKVFSAISFIITSIGFM